MKLLLDTHIWVWAVSEPEKLTRQVARHLSNRANELWLSPLSIWEFLALHGKKRLRRVKTAQEFIAGSMEKLQLQEAPLTIGVASDSLNFALPHKDPFDTLLVATARIFDLTLVTADENIIASKAVRILANR